MVGRTRAALAALGCVAFVMFASAAQAQQVGQASAIRQSAYQQPPQAQRAELHVSDSIIRNSALSTQATARWKSPFLDG